MRNTETDPELWFHRRITDHVVVHMLVHLNRVGVIHALAESGPATSETLAATLALEPRVLGAMLDYLAGVDDLIERTPDGVFSLSPFGVRFVERFSRRTADGLHINVFDVRGSAYAPVWSSLDRLLKGAVYGRDVVRNGDDAADGVRKLAVRIEPALRRIVSRLDAQTVVEAGITTGLLQTLAGDGLRAVGLDRSADELARAKGRATAAGVDVAWLQADFFEPETWAPRLAEYPPGVLFSVHLHEFAARGAERITAALAEARRHLRGWTLVAFEQPRLDPSARALTPEALWLYAQSNVLIHHLIGNGRVLTTEEWTETFARAGARAITNEPIDYLGYVAFVVTL